jgi:hypothetical protein
MLIFFHIYALLYPSELKSWEFGQEGGVNFCVWSERPLPVGKARAKTKNLLPSRRRQKPTFEFTWV